MGYCSHRRRAVRRAKGKQLSKVVEDFDKNLADAIASLKGVEDEVMDQPWVFEDEWSDIDDDGKG